eukprot:CAMPEP_0196582650 /NCGR_PEP_ID=MMETSP1081-20130531/39947_1 /TAXON_ID=36882 /ORGANISM="Pyramimonas amylifera, Strain CCMP720" /LENGTH=372 /DNA_ID=CAMNT_0041903275 /DNA_START=218 /DNA_END=1333 /DNA_ORIENTATION=+
MAHETPANPKRHLMKAEGGSKPEEEPGSEGSSAEEPFADSAGAEQSEPESTSQAAESGAAAAGSVGPADEVDVDVTASEKGIASAAISGAIEAETACKAEEEAFDKCVMLRSANLKHEATKSPLDVGGCMPQIIAFRECKHKDVTWQNIRNTKASRGKTKGVARVNEANSSSVLLESKEESKNLKSTEVQDKSRPSSVQNATPPSPCNASRKALESCRKNSKKSCDSEREFHVACRENNYPQMSVPEATKQRSDSQKAKVQSSLSEVKKNTSNSTKSEKKSTLTATRGKSSPKEEEIKSSEVSDCRTIRLAMDKCTNLGRKKKCDSEIEAFDACKNHVPGGTSSCEARIKETKMTCKTHKRGCAKHELAVRW